MPTIDRSPMRRAQPAPAPAPCHVLLDFDGTVAPDDPTDRLLDRFAAPAWREIEAEWQAGRIASRECMQRQVALLRATPSDLDAAIAEIGIDPAFYRFVDLCRRQGVDMTIVSDGFDRVVESVLRRARLRIRFFANRLEWQGANRWRLSLPHRRGDCRTDAANCKCAHGTWRLGRSVVVGDGRSDFCMSVRADHVIAKGALAEFCCAQGLSHASFRNFGDATERLAEWLQWGQLGWGQTPRTGRRGQTRRPRRGG